MMKNIWDLADEALACGICGVQVPAEGIEQGGREIVRSRGRERVLAKWDRWPDESPSRAQHLRAAAFTLETTRCSSCLERRHEAEELMREFPEGRGRYRSDSLAYARAEHALAALAAIDERVELTTTKEVRQLLEALSSIGSNLTWKARYAPVAEDNASVEECAAWPFAHVSETQRRTARAELLAWRVRRAERPIGLLPPVGDACFLCGIASVTMLPSQRARAWKIEQVRLGNFGGSSDERREVAVCRECLAERHGDEPLGYRIVERLVKRASGIKQMLGGDRVTTNAYPWGLAGRAKPNTAPWGHLDLEDLRRQIATTSWIGQQ